MADLTANIASLSDAGARSLLHALLENVDLLGRSDDGTAFCLVALPPAILDRLAVWDADGDPDIDNDDDREEGGDLEPDDDLEPDYHDMAVAWAIRRRWAGPRKGETREYRARNAVTGEDGIWRPIPHFQDITAGRVER